MASKAAIICAAIEGWRAWLMRCDNRGAVADNEGSELIFDAHTDYYKDSKSWIGKFTAVGCAPDARTATMNNVLDAKCRCGLLGPTRRHWLWTHLHYNADVDDNDRCEAEDGLVVRLVTRPPSQCPTPAPYRTGRKLSSVTATHWSMIASSWLPMGQCTRTSQQDGALPPPRGICMPKYLAWTKLLGQVRWRACDNCYWQGLAPR